MKRFTTIVLILWASLTAPVFAQGSDIEAVISDQIEAFRADDFETAFTFASPTIRGIFQTPERFGQMVSRGYPMVHRPAEVTFGDLTPDASGVLTQEVLIQDQLGNFYVARYQMIPTENGWKINGVSIEQAPGVGV